MNQLLLLLEGNEDTGGSMEAETGPEERNGRSEEVIGVRFDAEKLGAGSLCSNVCVEMEEEGCTMTVNEGPMFAVLTESEAVGVMVWDGA